MFFRKGFDVILKRTDQVRRSEGYPASHFDAGVWLFLLSSILLCALRVSPLNTFFLPLLIRK
jgi:hypothetical protein